MTDTALLVREHRAAVAGVYLAGTLVCGLVATVAGIGLGRLWPLSPRRRGPHDARPEPVGAP
jgi:hypothetical protein